MDVLESHFAKAQLACVVTATPIEPARRGDVAVVQMDIARTRRGEAFHIYRGAAGNRVIATTVDPARNQLVLMVHEPRRRFEATVSKLQPVPRNIRILYEDKTKRVIEQFTSDRKRHFLCGMDESHYFIAQLPRAAPTVAEAHRVLRPREIKGNERRQGEWFFVEPTADDRAALELEPSDVVRRRIGIAEAARLSRTGRPHVADEVMLAGFRIFVRGAIRHPDHRTVRFLHWMRAIPNTESSDRPEGVRWID